MDWRLLEIDKRSVVTMVRETGAELARLGLGRVKLGDWLLDGDAVWGMGAGNHHMGTTRMGDDPKTSVVDKHCRVHGVANLHVAGSSVFTTSSWTNPTFTIVALATRLADRLKSVMQ
jgi:choline dehydrogenase-like flavoprotein